MQHREEILDICRRFDLLAVYLFGSRADDGLRLIDGERVERGTADLDVGIVSVSPVVPALLYSTLQVAFEDVFDPLAIDLVPLHHVDPLLAFSAIDGHRIAARDATAVDLFELDVMRRGAELLGIQRRLEHEIYGVSTS